MYLLTIEPKPSIWVNGNLLNLIIGDHEYFGLSNIHNIFQNLWYLLTIINGILIETLTFRRTMSVMEVARRAFG